MAWLLIVVVVLALCGVVLLLVVGGSLLLRRTDDSARAALTIQRVIDLTNDDTLLWHQVVTGGWRSERVYFDELEHIQLSYNDDDQRIMSNDVHMDCAYVTKALRDAVSKNILRQMERKYDDACRNAAKFLGVDKV